MKKLRLFLGMLLAPTFFILVWTLPVLEHSAFKKWLLINTVLAYVAFFFLAAVSHVVLIKNGWKKLWQYCVVMSVVSFISNLALSIWSLRGYTSYYYAQTQVVEHGSITFSGYILQIQEALVHGAIAAIVMALFWLIAVFQPRGRTSHV